MAFLIHIPKTDLPSPGLNRRKGGVSTQSFDKAEFCAPQISSMAVEQSLETPGLSWQRDGWENFSVWKAVCA